jgi:hypothetical protein
MWQRWLMRLLVALSAVATIGGLAWMLAAPPPGMKATRDGVPYLTPPVVHPITGEVLQAEALVRHYRGVK